jgi:hypothetical protein
LLKKNGIHGKFGENLGKIGILGKNLGKIGILGKNLGKIGILAKNLGKSGILLQNCLGYEILFAGLVKRQTSIKKKRK